MGKKFVELLALLLGGIALVACAAGAPDAPHKIQPAAPLTPHTALPTIVVPQDSLPDFQPAPMPTLPTVDQVAQPEPTPFSPLVSPTVNSPATASSTPGPISLEIFSPIDGSGVEVGATRVMGRTSADFLDINGVPIELQSDGTFQRDLPLREGVNLLELVASTPSGRTRSEQVVVFVVSPVAALPFSLLHPQDGSEVKSPSIPVVGVTRPDAVVGVNGVPVEVNELGVFSTSVPLVEGDNLIEVVATDIREVRFQTVAVFHLP